MKKYIIMLILFIILKKGGFIDANVIFVIIPIFFIYFLIRKMFKSATGKTRNGRTGTIYDDYLD